MNIVSEWTLKTIKKNKSRTIVTIIGIILSAALITAVATLCVSFQQYLVKVSIEKSGNWHARTVGISYADALLLSEDKQIKSSMLQRTLGYQRVFAEGPFHEQSFRGYLSLTELDEESLDHFRIDLVQGKLPKNNDEVVLSNAFNKASGKFYQVGDTVVFELDEQAQSDGDSLEGEVSQQHSQPNITPTKEYTVVGIMDTTNVYAGESSYTAISYLDASALDSNNVVDVYFLIQNLRDTFEVGEVLKEKFDPISIEYNTPLLQMNGANENRKWNIAIYGIGGIMFVIIIIGSIAMIYNTFAISVSERLRQFGMLSSVGATKRQLRNSVLFEGFFLGITSVPIGMISGILSIGVTLELLKPFLGSFLTDGIAIDVVISWYAIGFTFVLGMITILISSWIPANKAANISAMDAIRQSNDIKITSREVKTSKLTKTLFGFVGELAIKNLKRNKGKYRATVFSFFISIVLFISVSSFTMYLKNTITAETFDLSGDIWISFISDKYENEDKLIVELTTIDGVADYSIHQNMSKIMSIPTPLLNPKFLKEIYPGEQSPYMAMGVTLYGINDEDYRRFVKSEGLSYDDYNDPEHPKAIAINRTRYIGKNATVSYFDMIKKNSTIDVQILNFLNQTSPAYNLSFNEKEDGSGSMAYVEVIKNDKLVDQTMSNYFNLEDTSIYDILIAHETTNSPRGIARNSTSRMNAARMDLLISEDLYEKLMKTITHEGYEYVQVILDAADANHSEEIMDQAYDLFNKNGKAYNTLYNMTKSVQESRNVLIVVSVFGYSFITLISLIAMANMFNTISTNISLRRREFSMLKSIGMTPKSFNQMIVYESGLYGIKALLYGLPVGILISFAMNSFLEVAVSGVTGVIPWKSVLSCVIGVFVIVFMTMRYAMKKIKKENIIDALKTETI